MRLTTNDYDNLDHLANLVSDSPIAHKRVFCALMREIDCGFREGARGAAKGLTREIKRLC